MINLNLNIAKSSNSIPVWAIPFSPVGSKMFINNGSPLALVVPEGVNVAIFGYNSGAKVFVNEGAVFEALPTLGILSPSTAIMNPSALWATPGSTLNFQTLNTSGDVVTISFYNNQENK